MTSYQDKIYLEELQRGSQKAFNHLYDLYSDSLYGFVLLHTKSSSLAEDIVQDTFIKIWTNKHKLDSQGSFKSLLYTIAKNQFLDMFRKQINKDRFVDFVDFCETEGIAHSPVESDLLFDEFCEKLSIAKKELSGRQREIFELSREQGLDIKTIADQLDITEQTVKNQLTSALKQLREKLKEYNYLFVLYITFLS